MMYRLILIDVSSRSAAEIDKAKQVLQLIRDLWQGHNPELVPLPFVVCIIDHYTSD